MYVTVGFAVPRLIVCLGIFWKAGRECFARSKVLASFSYETLLG